MNLKNFSKHGFVLNKYQSYPNFKFIKKNNLIYLLVIFIFLSVAFLAYSDLFLELSTKVPGGRNRDVLFHLSIIKWTITASLADIYHLPFFYPLAYLRAANQPLFFQSIFFKVLGWIGANTEISNNLYIIFAWLVGAFGCFLLCREFTSDFFFPLVFSSIYIIHQLNFLYIKWINFISLFFSPYILYFFIQYLKSKKDKYAFFVSVLLVLQIMASLFYGFYSWIFFILLIFLSSFLLGLISINEIKDCLFYLLIGIIVVFICFSPYLDTQSRLIASKSLKIDPYNLITGDILFYYSKIWDYVFENAPRVGIYYFPGFVFLFFVLAYPVSFIERRKLKYTVLASLYLLSVLISLFVYINQIVMDYLFLLLILGVFLTVSLKWKKVAKLEKAILLCFSLFFLIFVYFPHIPILKSISIYSFIQYIFPILGTGLRSSRRVFFILAPFMVFFATLGAVRLFQFQKGKEYTRLLVVGLIFILMYMENYRPDRKRIMMQSLPAESSIYQFIPHDGNQVLLEIPFHFNQNWKNIDYIFNQTQHHNPIINGKSTWKPVEYLMDLERILTPKQLNFPTEQKIKFLIQNYSVTHIIFHWDLIKQRGMNETDIRAIRNRVQKIKKFGKIIYESENYTILKTLECFPIKRIDRSFSLYHLRRHLLQVHLASIYKGEIRIFLNGRFIQKKQVSSKNILIDLRQTHLEKDGNRLSILFNNAVRLDKIVH